VAHIAKRRVSCPTAKPTAKAVGAGASAYIFDP
jgi:hypothetical protein